MECGSSHCTACSVENEDFRNIKIGFLMHNANKYKKKLNILKNKRKEGFIIGGVFNNKCHRIYVS